MGRLIILIGLPRSGKSTWVRDNNKDSVVISADQFRQLMYGQRFYSEGEGMVWATRDICLKILLQQGVDIIIDETNTTAAGRAKIIKLAKKYNYDVDGVYFDVPSEVCIDRAIISQQRDLIPIIDKMANQLDEPLLKEEGFRSLTTLPYHKALPYTVEINLSK